MFTIKATYRGETRKFSFATSNSFPTFEQLCNQASVNHICNLARQLTFSQRSPSFTVSSPSATTTTSPGFFSLQMLISPLAFLLQEKFTPLKTTRNALHLWSLSPGPMLFLGSPSLMRPPTRFRAFSRLTGLNSTLLGLRWEVKYRYHNTVQI